jgi:hypothetical protein
MFSWGLHRRSVTQALQGDGHGGIFGRTASIYEAFACAHPQPFPGADTFFPRATGLS